MTRIDLFSEPYTEAEVSVLLNELRNAAEERRVLLNPLERYQSMPLEMLNRLKRMSGHIKEELIRVETLIEKVTTMVGATSAAVLNFDERVMIARTLLVRLAMAKKHDQRSYIIRQPGQSEILNIRIAINAYRKLGIDMRKIDPDFAAEAHRGANSSNDD